VTTFYKVGESVVELAQCFNYIINCRLYSTEYLRTVTWVTPIMWPISDVTIEPASLEIARLRLPTEEETHRAAKLPGTNTHPRSWKSHPTPYQGYALAESWTTPGDSVQSAGPEQWSGATCQTSIGERTKISWLSKLTAILIYFAWSLWTTTAGTINIISLAVSQHWRRRMKYRIKIQ